MNHCEGEILPNTKPYLHHTESNKAGMNKPDITLVADTLKEKYGQDIISSEQHFDFPGFCHR